MNQVKAMATGHCRVLGCGEIRSELTEGHSDQSGDSLRITRGGSLSTSIQEVTGHGHQSHSRQSTLEDISPD